MSTLDPDDDLRALLDGLDIEEPNVPSVQDMSNRDLVINYNAVQRALTLCGELREATTEGGRALHSQHGALLVELHRRNLR